MNKLDFILYNLFKTYNQASNVNSVNKIINNQFTVYDFRKELFDESVNHLIKNPLYREFIKAYVK